MSKLKDLIAEFCPHGVELKKIAEIAKYEQPNNYIVKNTNYKDNFNIPVLTAGQSFILGYTDEENGIYQATPDKPVIIFDDFTGSFKWVDFNFKIKSSAIKIITVKEDFILLRYLFHMMGKINFTSSAHRRLWIETYSNFKIPVPPLPVQNEIVRILDTFTELISELAKELQLRKKQYEYYASKLFLDTNAENYSMGELAKFVYGFTDKAKDTGDARFIRITDINEQGYLKETDKKYITLTEESKKSLLKKGDLIMARTGATFGKTLYFNSDFPSVYASFLIKIIPCERLLARYYWHFTKTPLYWEQANKLVTVGGQQQFNTPALKKIKIPVPPLAEQERIVNILDKFDKLCNDLCEGIPAEIAARKKQYEYYRDLLLTFEEKN